MSSHKVFPFLVLSLMQFSRTTSHLPEPPILKSTFYFSFPRYRIIDLKMQVGKIFRGYKASYNLTARILPQALFLPQTVLYCFITAFPSPSPEGSWNQYKSFGHQISVCLQCCHSASAGSVLSHFCPHCPSAVVSLQHSQSPQQLQHPSHSERPCLEIFRARVGKKKNKTKPGLERGRQLIVGQQAGHTVCSLSTA